MRKSINIFSVTIHQSQEKLDIQKQLYYKNNYTSQEISSDNSKRNAYKDDKKIKRKNYTRIHLIEWQIKIVAILFRKMKKIIL